MKQAQVVAKKLMEVATEQEKELFYKALEDTEENAQEKTGFTREEIKGMLMTTWAKRMQEAEIDFKIKNHKQAIGDEWVYVTLENEKEVVFSAYDWWEQHTEEAEPMEITGRNGETYKTVLKDMDLTIEPQGIIGLKKIEA